MGSVGPEPRSAGPSDDFLAAAGLRALVGAAICSDGSGERQRWVRWWVAPRRGDTPSDPGGTVTKGVYDCDCDAYDSGCC